MSVRSVEEECSLLLPSRYNVIEPHQQSTSNAIAMMHGDETVIRYGMVFVPPLWSREKRVRAGVCVCLANNDDVIGDALHYSMKRSTVVYHVPINHSENLAT